MITSKPGIRCVIVRAFVAKLLPFLFNLRPYDVLNISFRNFFTFAKKSMCLSVPAEILSIQGEMARASVGGAVREISLQMVENVKPGDFVLVHTGFAIEKIGKEEAAETLEMLRQLGETDLPEPEIG